MCAGLQLSIQNPIVLRMDKSDHEGPGARLAVSIVLYSPDRLTLERTISSLGRAIKDDSGGLSERTVVILVDHSPIRIPADWLEGLQQLVGTCAPLVYDHNGANPGFGAGNNHAFNCIDGADYFLVANPDIEFAPDSLAAGLAFLDTHPDIGLLAPALVEPDGGLRPACFRYPDLLTLLARLIGGMWASKRSFRYECRDWTPDEVSFSPPLVSGCCMLFRSTTFARLGGFDHSYFLYFEDFDLSLRAGRLGLSAYCPGMKITHQGGGASRKGIKHLMLYIQSALRFFSTHGWRCRV